MLRIVAIGLSASFGVAVVCVLGVLFHLRADVLPAWMVFDRRKLEAVVEEIRRRPIRPEEVVALRIDPTVTGSVRLVEARERVVRGRGAGWVWATRTKEGHLKVVIETRDMGHLGEYGYAYSEVPLTLVPLDEHWSTVDVPGRLSLVAPDAKIDDHWWAVVYNLD